jgi:hypothetical protein
MQTEADLKYPDFRHNSPSFSSSPKNFEETKKNVGKYAVEYFETNCLKGNKRLTEYCEF